jgi:hypothetical protein
MSRRLPLRGAGACALLLVAACGGITSLVPGGDNGPNVTTSACNKVPITVGGTVSGSTKSSANRCRLSDGATGNIYELVITQPVMVTIKLTANGFPGFVGLYSADGYLLTAQNTDPTEFPVALGAGTYLIDIDSMTGADGLFTLDVSPLVLSNCGLINATRGAEITATIVSSCPDVFKYRAVYIQVWSTSPQPYSVSLSADKLAAVNSTSLSGGSVVVGPGSCNGGFATSTQGVPFSGKNYQRSNNVFNIGSLPETPLPVRFTAKVQ